MEGGVLLIIYHEALAFFPAHCHPETQGHEHTPVDENTSRLF
jgi:hypothetical protein